MSLNITGHTKINQLHELLEPFVGRLLSFCSEAKPNPCATCDGGSALKQKRCSNALSSISCRMHVSLRLLVQSICLTSSPLFSLPANAIKPIHIGALAFRPKPQTLEQWQQLAIVLKRAIPEMDFVDETYTYPELEEAITVGPLGFVLPSHGIMCCWLNV